MSFNAINRTWLLLVTSSLKLFKVKTYPSQSLAPEKWVYPVMECSQMIFGWKIILRKRL